MKRVKTQPGEGFGLARREERVAAFGDHWISDDLWILKEGISNHVESSPQSG